MTRSQFVFGTMFVVLGTLLLLDQAEVVAAGPIIGDWWPTVVIAAGLAQLVTRPRNLASGALVGLIGVALLLWTLGIVDSLALLWPTVLIGIGLWLLVQRSGPSHHSVSIDGEVVTIFDDRSVRAADGPLDGRSITTVFGDIDLDLRATTIEGRVTLPVTTIFGDVDLDIPPHWRVTVSGPEIFGDVTVQRTSEPPPGAPELRLQVVTIFGDVTVRARETASL
jgi:predicted membrane protein